MTEKLFEAISAGALVVTAVLMLIVIARLARLEKVLGQLRGTGEPTSEDDPTASTNESTNAAEATAETSSAEATADEEGPYERDGRWWFRRGNEELVFDDRTETWTSPEVLEESERQEEATHESSETITHPLDEPRPQIAADIGTAEVGSDPVEPAAAPPVHTEPVATETPEEPRVITEETPAAHWKCPNCGVVNGSTATSCRMCFAARP